MPINLIQKLDLKNTSFTNDNTAAASGITVNVAVGGDVEVALKTASSPLNAAVKTAVGQMTPAQFGFNPDDVIEVANAAALPAAGQASAIYVTADNSHTWRWTGSSYVDMTAANSAGAATNAVAGIVALNTGVDSGDATNALDALTAAGFNALAGDAVGVTVNAVQAAIQTAALKGTAASGKTLTAQYANDGTTVLFYAYS